MKKVIPYAPYLIASGAILAAVYFLWYKPKKDEEAAKNAALQAAEDAKLTADNSVLVKLAKNISPSNLKVQTAAGIFNLN